MNREHLRKILENLRKILENLRKILENLRKIIENTFWFWDGQWNICAKTFFTTSSECRIVELLEWTLNDFRIKRNFLSRKKTWTWTKKSRFRNNSDSRFFLLLWAFYLSVKIFKIFVTHLVRDPCFRKIL